MAKKKTNSETVVVEKPYKEPELMPLSMARTLVEIRMDFQQQRIGTENRILMNCERNGIDKKQMEKYGVASILKDAVSFEKKVEKMLKDNVDTFPIYNEFLSHVHGIGPVLAMGLIAYIEDVGKYDNISKLWQMAGFGMNRYCNECEEPTHVIVKYENREAKKKSAKKLKPFENCPKCNNKTVPLIQKRIVGYQSNWNNNFKTLVWKVGQSFLKSKASKSGYRKLYDQFKAEEKQNHPEKEKKDGKTFYNDGHIHNRALRKVCKVFLAHIWSEWRRLDGLSVTKPYAGQLLNHSVIAPIKDR